MRSTMHLVAITLSVTIILMDAASLTTPEGHTTTFHDSRFHKYTKLTDDMNRGNISSDRFDTTKSTLMKDVHDMISEEISPSRFMAIKSTLIKDEGTYFHAMLGVNKNTTLPIEIGKNIFSFYSRCNR
jgi:hypothetical protein